MPQRKTQSKSSTTVEDTVSSLAEINSLDTTNDNTTPIRLVEDDTGHRALIYATEKGIEIDLRVDGGTFWATQKQMAEMFGVTRQNISLHLKNIFEEGELIAESTCKDSLHVGKSGQQYSTKLYNLNALISVGYRVNSKQGTMFRIWATDKLFHILTKNFYIDKERLKSPENPDVLDELRDIAREIRSSTQNVYREVKRLCTLCSDYDGSSQTARNFFMSMENKLLWASTSMTGPELIIGRADATQPDIGLTSFAGKKGPTQKDVTTANNYLAEGEAKLKNRITVMLLDYIEDQLDQGKLTTMAVASDKLEEFIKFNGWPFLKGFGRVKRVDADNHAKNEHKIYKKRLSNE